MKKEVRIYSRAFKLSVVSEYISGGISKESLRKKHGIKGKSAILNWMREFEKESGKEELNNKVVKDLEYCELEQENIRLREELKRVRLQRDGYNKMIEIVEHQLGEDIRKKYGSKQSK